MASPGGLSSAMEHGPTTVCPYFGLEGIGVPMPCAPTFSLIPLLSLEYFHASVPPDRLS